MIIVLLIYVFIALFQIPGLIKKKYWKELAAFSVFYMTALILSILYVLDINVLSPYRAVWYIVEDILHLAYHSSVEQSILSAAQQIAILQLTLSQTRLL